MDADGEHPRAASKRRQGCPSPPARLRDVPAPAPNDEIANNLVVVDLLRVNQVRKSRTWSNTNSGGERLKYPLGYRFGFSGAYVMAKAHVTYPNAPLALATFEVRFPDELGPVLRPGLLRTFRELLGEEWVTEQVTQSGAFAINLGAGPNAGEPTFAQQAFPPVPRFTVRDRTAAVMVGGGRLTVETTRYAGWSHFSAILRDAVRAASETVRPNGVTRVGLRYINEVRAENVQDVSSWGRWLSPGLLPPVMEEMVHSGWRPTGWTGLAQYQMEEDQFLLIRYGPQAETPGFAVPQTALLRRPDFPSPSAFFLVDLDASWQPASVPEWQDQNILASCETLHESIEFVFDQLVTDALVTDVFQAEISQ